jgi:protein SCO1/2
MSKSNHTRNKKIFFFSIFLIPSLLCLGFYYFAIRKPLTQGRTNIFVKLPHYGPTQLLDGDSVFYTLPSFKFVNQNGEEVSSRTLKNKIYVIGVANFNSSQADQIAAQLYRAQDKLSYLKKDFKLITVMNEIGNDTLKNLRTYAEKVHAEVKIWQMVAGNQQEILSLFEQNTLLKSSPTSFINDMELLLIDRNNKIRGHYNGGNLKEVNRMIDEVVVLAAEYGKIKNM